MLQGAEHGKYWSQGRFPAVTQRGKGKELFVVKRFVKERGMESVCCKGVLHLLQGELNGRALA